MTTLKGGWREYQAHLKRARQRRQLLRKLPNILAAMILVAGACYALFFWISGTNATYQTGNDRSVPSAEAPQKPQLMSKAQVRQLMAGHSLINLTADTIPVDFNGQTYRVVTAIDVSLQRHILKKLNPAHNRYIGIVALEPVSGRILAMVGFDSRDPGRNTCVSAIFPAASIFKIVTAAGAIDGSRMTADTVLLYNGRKHTLYKSQLKKTRNKYTRRISLSDSFAQSINPVFGKLGVFYLGKDGLEASADAFGFNRDIPLEIPVTPSAMTISEKPYNWAEIASGFNKDTTLSPLHGAMIVSAVLNDGRMPEPTIVKEITDSAGRVVYRHHDADLGQALSPRAAEDLQRMMRATINSGTGRKSFRGHRKQRVLARLDIGGKTGSINNDPRYDWFVGFAGDKKGARSVVVSAVVAHEEYIGTRAAFYARQAFEKYFGDYFKKQAGSASAEG